VVLKVLKKEKLNYCRKYYECSTLFEETKERNMGKRRVFGELEYAILGLVAKHQPVSVKEVVQLLGNKDQYTTIMTVMSRLAEKGKLSRVKEGRQYVYGIASPSPRKKALKRLFGVGPIQLVAHLLDAEDELSAKEIEQLEELIKRAKKGRAK